MDYRVSFSKVMAGRMWPDESIELFEDSKFGFYWWSWLPEHQTNGGKFKKRECVDVSVRWFCFSLGLTFWPK